MQYMVRFTYGTRTGTPIGFHDIPQRPNGSYSQTVAQLGRPLSHGCVRQADRTRPAVGRSRRSAPGWSSSARRSGWRLSSAGQAVL
jgi:hypothetical protein